ncbi:MAG: hypothetical protein ACKVX9_05580 [Blastocatellia bacterium]
MPDNQTQVTNSQTLVINAEDFSFEPLEQHNGMATVLKFKLENPSVIPGDVLLILAGEEVQFHGLIGRVEDGWATASDRNGSMLSALVH